jgi:oligopeptide transport system substrate-binding protein
MKKIIVFILLLVLITSFATACGRGNKLASVQELTVAVTEEPVTLDPQKATQNIAYTIINNVMEGLVHINDEGEIEPALAKSWHISQDQLTYTFTLRDAKWSDNTSITAYDIEYSLKRALDASFSSDTLYQMFIIYNAYEAKYKINESGQEVDITSEDIGIVAIDDKTLKITLKEPASYFLALLANPVFIPSKEDRIEVTGTDYATTPENMVYSGPYIVKNWTKGERIILTKNPYYWDSGNVILDEIDFIIEPQSATIVKLFQQGEVDLFKIPSSYTAQFMDQETLKQVISATAWYIQFNCSNKYFSNNKIRQAFAMAIDRDEFLDSIKSGTANIAYSLTSPSIPLDGKYLFTDMKDDIGYISFDVEKANQLLDEGLDEIGATRKEFEKEITFLSGEGDVWTNITNYLSNQLQDVFNIDLNIDIAGDTELIISYQNKEYAFTFSGTESDCFDPLGSLEKFTSNNPNNFSYFSNKEYDTAIIEARENDKNKKINIIQAERILAQQVPILTLYHSVDSYALRSNVKGIVFIPVHRYIDFKKAYIVN